MLVSSIFTDLIPISLMLKQDVIIVIFFSHFEHRLHIVRITNIYLCVIQRTCLQQSWHVIFNTQVLRHTTTKVSKILPSHDYHMLLYFQLSVFILCSALPSLCMIICFVIQKQELEMHVSLFCFFVQHRQMRPSFLLLTYFTLHGAPVTSKGRKQQGLTFSYSCIMFHLCLCIKTPLLIPMSLAI